MIKCEKRKHNFNFLDVMNVNPYRFKQIRTEYFEVHKRKHLKNVNSFRDKERLMLIT